MQRAGWFAVVVLLYTCVGWTADKPSLKLNEDDTGISGEGRQVCCLDDGHFSGKSRAPR